MLPPNVLPITMPNLVTVKLFERNYRDLPEKFDLSHVAYDFLLVIHIGLLLIVIKLLCPRGTQTCALAVYNLIVHSSAAA